jgi:hypothetical protein
VFLSIGDQIFNKNFTSKLLLTCKTLIFMDAKGVHVIIEHKRAQNTIHGTAATCLLQRNNNNSTIALQLGEARLPTGNAFSFPKYASTQSWKTFYFYVSFEEI